MQRSTYHTIVPHLPLLMSTSCYFWLDTIISLHTSHHRDWFNDNPCSIHKYIINKTSSCSLCTYSLSLPPWVHHTDKNDHGHCMEKQVKKIRIVWYRPLNNLQWGTWNNTESGKKVFANQQSSSKKRNSIITMIGTLYLPDVEVIPIEVLKKSSGYLWDWWLKEACFWPSGWRAEKRCWTACH
jgi:hypothetical protein